MLLLPLLLAVLGVDEGALRDAPVARAHPSPRGDASTRVGPAAAPEPVPSEPPANAPSTPAATGAAAAAATTSTSAPLGDPDLPARPPARMPGGLRAPDVAPAADGPTIPIPSGAPDSGEGPPPEDDPDARYTRLLGRVVDEVTEEPLGEVEVSLPELDLRALTDKEGWFMIHGIRIRERPYEALLSRPGYHNLYESLRFTAPGSGSRTFELKPRGW